MSEPLSVKCHRGMEWRLYGVEFESPDGKFGFNIYAISDEHAAMQVEAIRETAALVGRIEGTIPG
jgi:hypothetical protein